MMMKIALLGILTVVLSVLVIVLYILFVPANDIVHGKYATYAEVVKRDAYAHGMVPDFLPKSATAVISERNIDLNVMVVEFSYGEDFSLFLLNQKVVELPPSIAIPRLSGSIIDLSNIALLDYVKGITTSDKESHGTLVVNPVQKRAVFWSGQ